MTRTLSSFSLDGAWPSVALSDEMLSNTFTPRPGPLREHLHAHSKSRLPLLLNPTHPLVHGGRHHTRRKPLTCEWHWHVWKRRIDSSSKISILYHTISHSSSVPHSSPCPIFGPSTDKLADNYKLQAFSPVFCLSIQIQRKKRSIYGNCCHLHRTHRSGSAR